MLSHRFTAPITFIGMAAALLLNCLLLPELEGAAAVETDEVSAALQACPPDNPQCGVDPDPDPEPDPNACGKPLSATLVATPPTIQHGQSATLQWSVKYSRPCNYPTITVNGQPVALQDSMTVAPLATWHYVLIAVFTCM